MALFGDEVPMTAPTGPKVGRCLVGVDPRDWTLHALTSPPLARPIDVEVNPADSILYILKFGLFEMDGADGLASGARTGRILRVVF